MRLFLKYIVLIFFLTSCAHRKAIIFPKSLQGRKINLVGFSDLQIASLKDLFETLSNLKAEKLQISNEVYERNSRFKKLFGFEFNGFETHMWLLDRIKDLSFSKDWTVATLGSHGHVNLGTSFFSLSNLEMLYTLIHEARHADGNGHAHVKCPNYFPFVSAGSPNIDLTQKPACDDSLDGAYSFHSAFLFECYAYGLLDARKAGLLYNSSVSRVLPLLNKK